MQTRDDYSLIKMAIALYVGVAIASCRASSPPETVTVRPSEPFSPAEVEDSVPPVTSDELREDDTPKSEVRSDSPKPDMPDATRLPTVPTTPIELPAGVDASGAIASSSGDVNRASKSSKHPALALGTFVSGEHPTKGTMVIVDDDGTPVIEFGDDFQTDSGPDLFLVLHVAEDVLAHSTPPNYPLKEGDYVAIAPLKQTQGAQSYSIPAAIILDNYQSLAIWCRQFNATFGATSLRSPNP